ncbi:Cof-type HAD-IIB family hydrolase [Microbacterium arborescens]|uniref:Cof-type HAD-IIB family hydrolase n=1 Tax=Microbacterium TaxID=33882 RepID=UPI0025A299CA|nr:Cof-type HAD-IIB family hydrolase [Microbacterium arborescens]WJM16116.1 Cof-type HAD-IIB family hydrolase [Microbacterium arborescens]
MTSETRIIFLDVDGTILAHGETIAPSTIAAVRAARERGHLVYLCTGRAAGDINPRVLDIGFDGAISNGGALAVSGDETVLAELMPRTAVERVMAYFDEQGTRYFIQSHDGVYASEGVRSFIADFISDRRRRHAEDLSTVALAEDVVAAPRFAPVEEADLDHIAKAVFVSSDPDAVEKTQAALGEEFHVIPGSMPLPTGSNGEVGMRGTNKGTGIQAMLTHLGRDAADAVGIGDSWNDVEMFEVCGTAIAMAEADPQLQQIAGEVTTGVLDDGIWNAFVRHGIIDPETAA